MEQWWWVVHLFTDIVCLYIGFILGGIGKLHLQSTIERQNDTIQRLINREPVTYQETNQKQPKIIEESYSAWGNVTIDREVDDDGR